MRIRCVRIVGGILGSGALAQRPTLQNLTVGRLSRQPISWSTGDNQLRWQESVYLFVQIVAEPHLDYRQGPEPVGVVTFFAQGTNSK